ncbi:hydroxymethylglutaryl-CoA lyase [soil metagenome]
MADRVRITDVAARDGLQNEPGVIATADKLKLAGLLAAAGVDEVELTSFVAPKWVPALADAEALVGALAEMLVREDDRRSAEWAAYFRADAGCTFSALVPNLEGLDRLLRVNRVPAEDEEESASGGAREVASGGPMPISKIAVFTAASETFCQKNLGCSIHESYARFRPVLGRAGQEMLFTRGYISCAIACPFEGPINPERVADVAVELAELGVAEIDLGDTIGAGTAQSTRAVIEAVIARLGPKWLRDYRLTLHLHDTSGHAAECVRAALHAGVRSFDGAAAGIGGCPYASTPTSRAPGNIDTGLLVRTVEGEGCTTEVDQGALRQAAEFAGAIVGAARARAGGGA